MTLLDIIKSLLGFDDGRSRGGSRPNDRTRTPSTGSEDAVKGTEGSTDDPAAAGGDAAGSTGSMTDESDADVAAEDAEAAGPTSDDESLELDHDGTETTGSADGATESAADPVGGGDGTAEESAAAGGDAAGSTGSITEETNDSISAAEDAEAAGPTDAEPGDTPDHAVDALKGIGPSYADQLAEAGIETVDDLADADPAALAEETGISESRVERWTERAKARRQ